jgi:membrane protein implicated in regulation of membrane protease activity
MEQYAWLLWIVLGVILIITETFTLGFVLLWFGIGALAAALVGLLGFGMISQFLVFAIVSIALTALSRTIFARYYSHGDEEKIKTGIDSLPGQIGTVTIASKGALQEGAVKVYGSTWTAFPELGEEPLMEGEKVEVIRVQGSSIYVKRIGGLPEWREDKSITN